MKRVVFLISDTGGGHRAAARAVESALSHRFPGEFEGVYVDVFREYTPAPMKYAPEIYPAWIRHSTPTYGLYFKLTDLLLRVPLLRNRLPGLLGGSRLRDLVRDTRPDVLVVLHGMFSRFVASARESLGIDVPLVTVITDLARPHLAWYSAKVDRCLVPCPAAYDLALETGVPEERVRLVGHPAHPKFPLLKSSRAEARAQLGWDPDLPAAMILGGGEGMGALEAIARAVDARGLDAQLAMVCGRNEELKAKLEGAGLASRWHLYGFIDFVEVMMRASDALVTKAGPGTIAEAAIVGLPMVLYGAIPFQESPNIGFVTDGGAGVEARDPEKIADVLERWLTPGNEERAGCAAAARALAYPHASFDIAEEIAGVC